MNGIPVTTISNISMSESRRTLRLNQLNLGITKEIHCKNYSSGKQSPTIYLNFDDLKQFVL